MNRVGNPEAYTVLKSDGRTYRPRDGHPVWETFPFVAIAEQNGSTRRSLGACADWKEDPYGVPDPEDMKYVTFISEGPDAEEVIEIVKEVFAEPLPEATTGMLWDVFGDTRRYLAEQASLTSVYRPPSYRPAPSPRPPGPTIPKPRPRPESRLNPGIRNVVQERRVWWKRR